MRDIKFRAWDLDNKWMDDGFFIQSNGVAHDKPSRTFDTPNIEIEENPSLVIMQFTGLKDCNGADIYESDLLYHHKQGVREVKYGNEHFDYAGFTLTNQQGMINTLQNPEIYKIIGNIHENPELMERDSEK